MTDAPGVAAEYQPTPAEIRRVVWSSFLGTALEWYDFFLFGTTAAIVFAPLFFPASSPTASTLQSFVVFAVGFIARPFGAVLFGHFGDRLGRKGTLIATLTVMGTATTLMGVLPDYHTAGIVAPVLLTLLRFVQGLATGGEWGGATLMALEFAPEKERGLYASVVQMGSPAGNILSTGAIALVLALTGPAFLQWGWRIPYLLSIALVLVALWMRSGLTESPEFAKLADANEVQKLPFFDLVREAWPRLLVATMSYLYGIAGFFMMTTYGISYVTHNVGANPQIALNAILAGAVAEVFTLWFAGRTAMRIGPVKTVALGYLAAAIGTAPFFFLLDTGNMTIIAVAFVLGLGLSGIPYGPVGAVMNRLFPRRYAYSGLAVAANLAGLISGFMPYITATVTQATGGSAWGPTVLIVGIALISLVGVIIAGKMIESDSTDRPIGLKPAHDYSVQE
ncbi:MFS transporter [Nigerium massiliense]|uniref:MFS transporter n=1 Tax=Nigerium massiliense TaxID=1522317 RepID=UPI0005905550|nr:MFS transporter [Nigerium massiliense]